MDTNQTKSEKKEKDDKKEGLCSIFCTSLFQLAMQGLLGYLAFIVSTRPVYFGDPLECYELRIWTYRYAILNFYVMGWDSTCLVISLIAQAFSMERFLKFIRTFNGIIYPFIFMLYIACFILLTVFFFFWENCGKCRTFVCVMILSFWISVCLFFFNMGCSTAFCMHAVKGLYERRFTQNNQLQQNVRPHEAISEAHANETENKLIVV
jgi:hypothetical protein